MAQKLPGPTVSAMIAGPNLFDALHAAHDAGRAFLVVPFPGDDYQLSLKDEGGAAEILNAHRKKTSRLFRAA